MQPRFYINIVAIEFSRINFYFCGPVQLVRMLLISFSCLVTPHRFPPRKQCNFFNLIADCSSRDIFILQFEAQNQNTQAPRWAPYIVIIGSECKNFHEENTPL